MADSSFKEFVDAYCGYPDFPQPGIYFIDIFPILAKYYPADFKEKIPANDAITFIPEARGFLFYEQLNPKLVVPLRKKGKLPGHVEEMSYVKEYGPDRLFFQLEGLRRVITEKYGDPSQIKEPIAVTFFDDLLATGGTAAALIDKLNTWHHEGFPQLKVARCLFYLELDALNGRSFLEEKGVVVESIHHY